MREYEFEQRPDVPERSELRTRHKRSDLKNLRKEIGICRSCNALIWWGYRFGRPFPYDVGFENDGTPYRRAPHKETCPYASDYQPSNRGNLRDRADAHTEAVQRWKLSCASDTALCPVDWTAVVIHAVPEKHAVRHICHSDDNTAFLNAESDYRHWRVHQADCPSVYSLDDSVSDICRCACCYWRSGRSLRSLSGRSLRSLSAVS